MESILGSACVVSHLPDHRPVRLSSGVFAGQVLCIRCDLETLIEALLGPARLLEMRESVERAQVREDKRRAKRGLMPKDWGAARAAETRKRLRR